MHDIEIFVHLNLEVWAEGALVRRLDDGNACPDMPQDVLLGRTLHT